MEVSKILEDIGLTRGESRVYLATLSLGRTTVGKIIEKSEISASKIYIILDKLIKKGLVNISVEDSKKKYSATNPHHLLDFLDREKDSIDKKKEAIQSILPQLSGIQSSVADRSIVEFSKGRWGYEVLYRETISDAKPKSENFVLANDGVSFKFQSLWSGFHGLLQEKEISSRIMYTHDCWYNKDKSIHRREERTNYHPKVLPKKFSKLPCISVLGDKTLISGVDELDNSCTLIIRDVNLTREFVKILEIIESLAVVPEGYEEK
jgi:predicted transcriptional regulator